MCPQATLTVSRLFTGTPDIYVHGRPRSRPVLRHIDRVQRTAVWPSPWLTSCDGGLVVPRRLRSAACRGVPESCRIGQFAQARPRTPGCPKVSLIYSSLVGPASVPRGRTLPGARHKQYLRSPISLIDLPLDLLFPLRVRQYRSHQPSRTAPQRTPLPRSVSGQLASPPRPTQVYIDFLMSYFFHYQFGNNTI